MCDNRVLKTEGFHPGDVLLKPIHKFQQKAAIAVHGSADIAEDDEAGLAGTRVFSLQDQQIPAVPQGTAQGPG